MKFLRLLPFILLFLPAIAYAQDAAQQPAEEVKLKAKWDKDSDGRYGYVDETGRFVIPPRYYYAGSFQDRLAVVQFNRNDYALINYNGEPVLSSYQYIHFQNPYYFCQDKDGKYSLLKADLSPVSFPGYDNGKTHLTTNGDLFLLLGDGVDRRLVDYDGLLALDLSPFSLVYSTKLPYCYQVMQQGTYFLIDLKGQRVSKVYKNYEQFSKNEEKELENVKKFIEARNAGEYKAMIDAFRAARERASKAESTLAASLYPARPRYLPPDSVRVYAAADKPDSVKIQRLDNGLFTLEFRGSNLTPPCKDIKPSGNGFILCGEDGKYGIADRDGNIILPIQKEYILPWYADSGKKVNYILFDNGGYSFFIKNKVVLSGVDLYYHWDKRIYGNVLAVRRNGKWGLLRGEGLITAPIEYDAIADPVIKWPHGTAHPLDYTGYGLKNGLCWPINGMGYPLTKRGYDSVQLGGKAPVVTLAGYSTELTSDGKETNPIAGQCFDDAYKIPNDQYQAQYDKYMQAIALDYDGSYTGACYCNIGWIFDRLGDKDTALTYYDKGAAKGNAQARKNAKTIRTSRTLEAISNALESVSNATSSIISTYSVQQGNYSGYSGGGIQTSGSSGGGKSASYYQTAYRNWERRAESNYNSITSGGARWQNSAGEQKGLSDHSPGNYTMQKQYLREAQREMQKIRLEAARNGVTIAQSRWETATVSYY